MVGKSTDLGAKLPGFKPLPHHVEVCELRPFHILFEHHFLFWKMLQTIV